MPELIENDKGYLLCCGVSFKTY